MTKINEIGSKLLRIYKIGFFIILALPILIWPPYFFPADWGKNIIFRSVMGVILSVFIYQFLYKRNQITIPNLKKNIIFWVLSVLFIVYLLASIFSVDPLFSFWGSPYRGGGFINFAFYFVFAMMAFILLKKDEWEKAWNFSLIIGIFVSSIAILQYYGLLNKVFLSVSDRPPSTMGNPILLSIYLLLMFFITVSFLLKEKIVWKKIFYTFFLILSFFVILITGSRAAYLGIAIGAIYFLLFYPKKVLPIKIIATSVLILLAVTVVYVNATANYPKFLQQNKLFNTIAPRLYVRMILIDPRFSSWTGIDSKIIMEKPLLGYGPENFAIGFDKNYNPSTPYFDKNVAWWDRAHNIIIQTGSDAGILGIIAYLALFIILFWQLQTFRLRSRQENHTENALIATGIQATLIGYFTANFFSFDSFSTYLIFFFIIGYSLHLISLKEEKNQVNINIKGKGLVTSLLFLVLGIFLWQYNLVPFLANAQININANLASQKKCDQALKLMDKTLAQHSFLDSYVRAKYIEITKICSNFYPENNLLYVKKNLELLREAVKIQPFYTRYWIYLGSLTTTLAEQETNIATKNNLLQQANEYFDKALQLAPKHQEIIIGEAKVEIASQKYKSAEDYSEKCIALNPNLGDCYFYFALSKIYQKNNVEAQENLAIAGAKGFEINSTENLSQLSNAYGAVLDYKNLAMVYEKLISINSEIAQYHSSLASFYKEIGKYKEARQEALKVLQLSPESKPSVNAFLKTLP